MASLEASLTWLAGITIFRNALYQKISNHDVCGKSAEICLRELLGNESSDIVKQINSLLWFLARKREWQLMLESADISIVPVKKDSGKYRKI